MDPNWFVAIGTIVLAIVAVLQDKIRDFLWRPELDVEFSMTHPDCIQQKFSGIDTYYFRLKILNKGNREAQNVEVFATKLEKKDKRTFRKDPDFIPLNFCWTYYEADKQIKPFFIPLISPGTYKYCTMGKIISPNQRVFIQGENKKWEGVPIKDTILSFEPTFRTAILSFLHPPGKYRLHIIIAAANTKPVNKTIKIDLDGRWYPDPEEMYKKGIRINIEK